MARRTLPLPDRPAVEAVAGVAAEAAVVAGAGPLAPPPPPGVAPPTSSDPSPTRAPSVSFAASGAPRSTPRSTPPPWGAEGHALVGVGPGLSGASRRAGPDVRVPVPDHRGEDPPAAAARGHPVAPAPQRLARPRRDRPGRADHRGGRLRQDDAARRLGVEVAAGARRGTASSPTTATGSCSCGISSRQAGRSTPSSARTRSS